MKKTFNYKPIGFLGCLLIGISLQFYFKIWNVSINYLTVLLCSLLMLLLFLKHINKTILFTSFSFFMFICLGISSVYIQNPKNHENYFLNHKRHTSVLVACVSKILKTNTYYDKYIVTVLQTDGEKTRGKLLVNIKKDSATKKLKIDDQLFLKPVLKEINAPLNPHQFNYKNYLARQYVYHQVFIDIKGFIILNGSTTSFIGNLISFRNKIEHSLKKYPFSKDEFAVITALLLGQKQEISKDLLNDYTKAGAIHILAISGLHIGIILVFLSWLFYPLEKIKHGLLFKTVAIVCILWMFALITGVSASVVRAVTMFTFIAIGNALKKDKSTEHSLITAAFVILLIHPMFLFNVGFQLSYLAVFGIVYTEPIISSFWKPKHIIINKFWKLITVSIAAQVGILPLSLFYFHQFPGLFLLSNIIIIPFLSVILFSGIIIVFLALFDLLPTVVVIIYNDIIKCMNTIVGWISEQEAFLLTNISLSFLMMIVLYVLCISTFKFMLKKKVKQLIYLLVTVIVLQLVLMYENQQLNTKKEFVVFHKSRKSILGKRIGNQISIYHDTDTLDSYSKMINTYEVGEGIGSNFQKTKPLIYKFEKQEILIIDSLGIYDIRGMKEPIVILQHSPKVNLNRIISLLKPKEIIADGSNYKSYINLWEQTCKQQKTPFYYTGKNGAYVLR